MPRSLRIEYPGAIYHVLNRGNYRKNVFGVDGSKEIFEEVLCKACYRSGWILHAYCLLDNHYHLALETPDANLSTGMQWFQSTFANRFNRNVRQRGHVFQGRYKSLIVEGDGYLGPLINYIHLNPLRAGLTTDTRLEQWRWSSLWYLFHKRKRWESMKLTEGLYYAGNLADTPAGRKKYVEYLRWLSASDKAKKDQCFAAMCQGWALGTREFKKELMTEDRIQGAERMGYDTYEARELYWERLLDQMLVYHGKSEREIQLEAKSASWKVMIAFYLKSHTTVTNSWLSQHLNMGVLHGVSRYTALFEKKGMHKKQAYKKMTARIKS